MPEKLDPKNLVNFKDLLMANSIQVDALSQLLIEKDFLTEREYFAKLKQVQGAYESGLDLKIGIYRDTGNGPCEVCMMQGEDWEEKVIDGAVVFN